MDCRWRAAQNANVTYRGVTIGRVEAVDGLDDGVEAHMRLNTDTDVPENVTATAKRPRGGASSTSTWCRRAMTTVALPWARCATVPTSGSKKHSAIAQDIAGEVLKQADDLVASVGDARIQDLLKFSVPFLEATMQISDVRHYRVRSRHPSTPS